MFFLLSGFLVLNSITFDLRNTRRNDSEGICLFTDRQLSREQRPFDLPTVGRWKGLCLQGNKQLKFML